jgi:hypothetical protein
MVEVLIPVEARYSFSLRKVLGGDNLDLRWIPAMGVKRPECAAT